MLLSACKEIRNSHFSTKFRINKSNRFGENQARSFVWIRECPTNVDEHALERIWKYLCVGMFYAGGVNVRKTHTPTKWLWEDTQNKK